MRLPIETPDFPIIEHLHIMRTAKPFCPAANPGVGSLWMIAMIVTPLRRIARTAGLLCLMTTASLVSAQMPTFKVRVATARTVEAPDTTTLVGTAFASRVSRVASEIAGIVDEMPVRQGDPVAKGDVLCRLNADTLRWQLAEAKSKRDALRAQYDELQAGTRKEDIEALKAALDEALADLDRWRFEVERVERLYSGSDSNAKELNDARAEYAKAKQRVAAAKAEYEKGVAGPRTFEVDKAKHDVAAQDALVGRLQLDIEKSVIRAPFSGAVVDRFVELGEWVGAGDQVVEVAELTTMLVRVDAPESSFPYLVVGDPARMLVDALDRSFEGKIKHVIPRATANARTVPVEIEVDNAEGLLADGMFARVVIRSGPARSVVAVPKDAIVERDGRFYVATVQPGRRGGLTGMLRPVTVGVGTADWIAITSGTVAPGTTVIVRGTERMAPFPMPVEVVDELGRTVERPPVNTKEGQPAEPKHPAGHRREGA